jgi:hypothetical protein
VLLIDQHADRQLVDGRHLIGAALATLTQEKPPVAASPIAVESLRKSRRANSFVIIDLS